jgi:hypothetical protein
MDGTSLCQNWRQYEIAQSSDTHEDVLLGGPADDKGQEKRQVEGMYFLWHHPEQALWCWTP